MNNEKLTWEEISSSINKQRKLDASKQAINNATASLEKLSQSIDGLTDALSDVFPPPEGRITWK